MNRDPKPFTDAELARLRTELVDEPAALRSLVSRQIADRAESQGEIDEAIIHRAEAGVLSASAGCPDVAISDLKHARRLADGRKSVLAWIDQMIETYTCPAGHAGS